MNESPAPTAAPQAPPRRRWLLRLVVGAALFGAATVALYAWLDSVWDRALNEAIAEADRTDPGWRIPDQEAKRPAIPDEENGSVQIMKVKASRPPKWFVWYHPAGTTGIEPAPADPQAFDRALNELPPQVLLNEEQTRLVRAELKRGEKAVDEARRMVDFPKGRNPITWREDYVSSLLPWSQEARSISEILQYDVMLRCRDGDTEGAMTSCRASFNASRVLRDEPTLVSMLIRVACRGRALRQLERVLAQGEPSPQSLAAFQKELEDDEPENLFLVAVRGDRGLMDGFLQAVQRGEVSHTQLKQTLPGLNSGGSASGLSEDDLQSFLLTGSAKYERAEVLKAMNRAVEIARLPPEEQGEPLRQWRDSTRDGSFLVRKLCPPIEKVGTACRRGHAEMRCMIIMLAAERYRQEHGGRWPDRVDELVPQYLKAVPTDPFDGKPIRYHRTADGVTVYSVSQDGEDDGGVVLDKWLEKGSDWGFRLWDVEKRRQEPK